MKKLKIKTLDIQAKEWFDKVNGNSYFAAQITINFALPNEVSLKIPLQYGYGDYYLQASGELLQKLGYMKVEKVPGRPLPALWRYCEENKIVFRRDIQTGCLKRDVKRWGE